MIIWLTQKDKVEDLDAHGKSILNFQISLFIWCNICIPLVFLCGLGFVGLIIFGLISVILPIINAIKVSNGQWPSYPVSFTFLS
ncbi:MAG: DUF4870 domain-containing protein [Flavobacteriaceae bacterium]